MKPFAWYDDGTCRAGSEATAHRVVTDEQKSGMHASTAKSFGNPLYTAASPAAAQAEIARLRGALENLIRTASIYSNLSASDRGAAAVIAARAALDTK